MSPTLLEGLVVLVLIIVVWQIGVQLAPEIFRGLKSANDQLDKSSDEIEQMLKAEPEKKRDNP